MTREEQIIEKAGKDSEIFYKVNDNYGDCFHGGFIDGAKWADEHYKDGMVKLEDVCKWMETNFYKSKYWMSKFRNDFYIGDFIGDLRRAMGE